ncbi:unnamed protein product [Hydatigera taeniaeformis]|uniref:Expressed conserved protein n=1 Tax=Hydatigena taeniaeformis TaxID=6205 RepID=A0A0R3X382_HYDTA|nr:unnamed protein product [Hydatigera taeniaeformis]
MKTFGVLAVLLLALVAINAEKVADDEWDVSKELINLNSENLPDMSQNLKTTSHGLITSPSLITSAVCALLLLPQLMLFLS